MKKSSIFSDAYREHKIKRKRYRNGYVFLALFLVLLLFFIPYLMGKVNEYRVNGGKFPKPPALNGVVASEAIFQLSTGENLTVKYSKKGDKVTYTSVTGSHDKYFFDISPDNSKVVINEKAEESIFVIGSDLMAMDVGLKEFTGTDNVLIKRTEKAGTGFIWANNAKFLNNTTLVYVSGLTNGDKPLSIRSIDLNTGTDKELPGSEGAAIGLGNLTENGFEVTIDGVSKHISQDLKVE